MNGFNDATLLKIFGYVPDVKNVSLVCHRFYELVCTMNDPEMCVHAVSCLSDLDTDVLLESILNSTRIIRKIVINVSEQKPIADAILKKFGRTIEYLDIRMTYVSDFFAAITLVPNVSHLKVSVVSVYSKPPQKKRARSAQNQEPNLLQLKKLDLKFAGDERILLFFDRLADYILVELTLDHKSLPRLAQLFRSQSSIKKLTIVATDIIVLPIADPQLFDSLQLDYLECHAKLFDSVTNGSMLAKQINLKTLKLNGEEISADLLIDITQHLSQLETLSILVAPDLVGAISSISMLRNLKELSLHSNSEVSNVIELNEFSKLDNSRLEALTIEHCSGILNIAIYKMAISMHNLKSLRFHCHRDIQILPVIMRHFNQVRTLYLDASDRGNVAQLMRVDCFNPNLIDLRNKLQMPYSVVYVGKLVIDYPRLQKLTIAPTNKHLDNEIEAILKGFQELKVLIIMKMLLQYRQYNPNGILEHGKALKFLALTDIMHERVFLDDQNVKDKFGVMKYSSTYGLRMAVDKKWMKVEMDAMERFLGSFD